MKKFLKGLGIFLGAFLLALVVLVVIGCLIDEDEPSSGTAESTPVSSAPESTVPASQPAAEPTPEPAGEPAEEPAGEPTGEPEDSSGKVRVGSTVETGYFSIAYGECDSDWRGYGSIYPPKNGNRVVRTYFTFENIDNRDNLCSALDFSCYADGVACKLYSYWASQEDKLTTASLSPGRIGQGYVYFEVPAGAGEIELEYDDASRFTNNRVIFIVE